MSDGHTQVRISKEDMEKLHNSGKNSNNDDKPKKPKLKTSTLVLRIVFAVIAVAYVVALVFGNFFLPKDFMDALNPFSGAENPNNVIRCISMCILVLCVGTIIRAIISKVAAKRTAEKKERRCPYRTVRKSDQIRYLHRSRIFHSQSIWH